MSSQAAPDAVVFWGATGQAKVLRECVAADGKRLVALFDNDPRVGSPFPDVPIFHGEEGFARWKAASGTGYGCLVAIGGSRGRDRIEIQAFLTTEGLVPIRAVHSTAYVAGTATVGPGSQILAQSAVGVDAALGAACIVNTGAIVDHDCRLEDGVHVGPGSRLAGEVTVQRYAFVGAGATVVPRVTIGEGTIVGAGTVVTSDLPPGVVAVGVPARVVRQLGADAAL